VIIVGFLKITQVDLEELDKFRTGDTKLNLLLRKFPILLVYFQNWRKLLQQETAFVELFHHNKDEAIAYCKKKRMWSTNTTGFTGVVAHKDGGFIVKASIKGVVHYVGYFKILEEAVNARAKFI